MSEEERQVRTGRILTELRKAMHVITVTGADVDFIGTLSGLYVGVSREEFDRLFAGRKIILTRKPQEIFWNARGTIDGVEFRASYYREVDSLENQTITEILPARQHEVA